MKSSVQLDRKLSATARLPKRSTIIESPAGKVAQPTGNFQHQHQPQLHGPDPALQSQRPSHAVTSGSSSQKPSTQGRAPPPRPPPPNQPPLNQYDPPGGSLSTSPQMSQDSPMARPTFARDNTRILVVEDKGPDSSTDDPYLTPQGFDSGSGEDTPGQDGFVEEEGLTLADIPQLLESEQAREQHRSLPRQAGKPLLGELSPLELLIIKHFAVLALQRSPLKDQFDLDDILELLEIKKNTFWNKLFKGNDKKNVKKKGKKSSGKSRTCTFPLMTYRLTHRLCRRFRSSSGPFS